MAKTGCLRVPGSEGEVVGERGFCVNSKTYPLSPALVCLVCGFKSESKEMAGRMSRGPWNKCKRGFFLLRLCRESLLTACKPNTLEVVVGEGFIIPAHCLTASAGFGAAPQGLGSGFWLQRRCCGDEFGRQRTARPPFGTSSPWESTWRALLTVCLNAEQLLVGTCRKAVTPYLQGWQ